MTTGIEVVTPHLGAFWMPAIAGVELCFFPAPYATTQQGTAKQELDDHTPPLRQHETPSSPRYRHQASKNRDDPYNDLPEQESPPEKQDAKPMTPTHPTNPPTNARETNAHPRTPAHERPPNEHPPTKTRHTNTTCPPKPTIRQTSTAKRLPPNQTFQTHLPKWVFSLREDHLTRTSCTIHPLRRVHFTVRHLTRRMHRSGPGQNTGPCSHPYPPILDFPQHIRGRNKYGATHPLRWVSPLPDIRLDKCTDQVQSKTQDHAAPTPPTLDFPQQRNTKQIRCHTPAEAGYHTIDTACDIPPL
ncbi:hypothetical protein BS47DRAFT_1368787 [Hydnum rufescens UP504]|uniref:Uncharacterized protein n=1 Tax=Hydnum rufescens UP504 TaxID=1448309 RepID=A0A9P6AGD7_9AGAM|nr:hypothetical protein BS47DRAFT_1368787 [Hydnum rufescens UP504]